VEKQVRFGITRVAGRERKSRNWESREQKCDFRTTGRRTTGLFVKKQKLGKQKAETPAKRKAKFTESAEWRTENEEKMKEAEQPSRKRKSDAIQMQNAECGMRNRERARSRWFGS
jgi:hypothetical protein